MIPRAHAVSRAILLIALLLLSADPLTGQRSSSEAAVPRATMRDFVKVLLDDGDQIATFFPRHGAWTWIVTTRYPSGRETVERREFPGGETPVAVEYDGRNCATLHAGKDTIVVDPLLHRMLLETRDWRRVGRNRFVPPDASPGSLTYIQWRRESGRWVVSAIGEEEWASPRLLGVPRNSVIRDPIAHAPLVFPLPANELYARGTAWYEGGDMIVADDRLLERYGLPRALESGEFTRIGTLNGVAVFVETGASAPAEIVYVPVDAHGSFQPYQNMINTGCP